MEINLYFFHKLGSVSWFEPMLAEDATENIPIKSACMDANDEGCIVFLDERVTSPNIKNQLPRYYQNEIKIVRNQIDCAEQLKKFWEKKCVRARSHSPLTLFLLLKFQ